MIVSVLAITFAFTTAPVAAQNAPAKAKTEKTEKAEKKDAKHDKAAGCTDKQKADCSSAKTGGCCGSKAAAAKPVPAPEKK